MPDVEVEGFQDAKSTLVSKNITVLGKRTSVRLEPEMWRALKDIAKREQCTMHDLCSLVSLRKNVHTSLTAAIRVFLMLYYRAATNEEGHRRAGHGSFDNMKVRAGLPVSWDVARTVKQDDYAPQSAANGKESTEPRHIAGRI